MPTGSTYTAGVVMRLTLPYNTTITTTTTTSNNNNNNSDDDVDKG